MSKRKKWGLIGGAVLVVAIIGFTTAFKGRNKATDVRIEPVERRDLVASVTASGQVQPQTKVDLSADITGRIVRLAVKEGDMVTKGQFLLEIDPSQYKASSERAAAAVASARSASSTARPTLVQAQRNYERLLALKKANPTLVSDEQVEQLRGQTDRFGPPEETITGAVRIVGEIVEQRVNAQTRGNPRNMRAHWATRAGP